MLTAAQKKIEAYLIAHSIPRDTFEFTDSRVKFEFGEVELEVFEKVLEEDIDLKKAFLLLAPLREADIRDLGGLVSADNFYFACNSKHCPQKYYRDFKVNNPMLVKKLLEAAKETKCQELIFCFHRTRINAMLTKALALVIKETTSPELRLAFVNSQIGDKAVEKLALAIKETKCRKLWLNLFQNKIGAKGAKALAEAITRTNCPELILKLGRSKKNGDEVVKALALAIKETNCPDLYFDLSQMDIGDEGAKALAEAIIDTKCKRLVLRLDENKIGDEGAKALAEATIDTKCPKLVLTLGNNQITDKGRLDVLNALEKGIQQGTLPPELIFRADSDEVDGLLKEYGEACKEFSMAHLATLSIVARELIVDGIGPLLGFEHEKACALWDAGKNITPRALFQTFFCTIGSTLEKSGATRLSTRESAARLAVRSYAESASGSADSSATPAAGSANGP